MASLFLKAEKSAQEKEKEKVSIDIAVAYMGNFHYFELYAQIYKTVIFHNTNKKMLFVQRISSKNT